MASTVACVCFGYLFALILITITQIVRHKTINTPRRILSPAVKADDMAGILGGIAKLDLGSRPVLVNNTNIVNAAVRETQEVKKIESDIKKEVIEISDAGPEPSLPPRFALQKARQLELLAKKTGAATTNEDLSKHVLDFIRVMQSNSGRTLTRPAFQFLDMLYKQLDDPSVFIQPAK